MFKSLTTSIQQSPSTTEKPRGFIVSSLSEEFELPDDDGRISETWNSSREMELECWRTYHTYARRFRMLERLEKFGTIESETEDEEFSNDDSLNQKKQKNCNNRKPSSEDGEVKDEQWTNSSFSLFHEKDDMTILANRVLLRRDKHLKWLFKNLEFLSAQKVTLDASRVWIVFWITHAIGLLDGWKIASEEELELRFRIVPFIASLKNASNGYGGGPRQLAHLLPTYASVASLINVGTEESFQSIDRQGVYGLIKRLRDPETKGFFVHEDGELDVRGVYCAVSIASMLHIVTDELFEGIEDYIGSLQSFDGGISGEPGLESHGGYTYCGFASLAILGKERILNLDELLYWVVSRQSDTCGGFNGRPNKLTDSCYSFWCSGVLALLAATGYSSSGHQPIFAESQNIWSDHAALQLYLLTCCQEGRTESIYNYKGGLRDKPLATPDFYHSCYALSGLSLSQYAVPNLTVVGPSKEANLLQQTDPFYNVHVECIQQARSYFSKLLFKAPNGETGKEGYGVLATLERQLRENRKQ